MSLEIQIRKLAKINTAINLINELLAADPPTATQAVVTAPLADLIRSRDALIKDLGQCFSSTNKRETVKPANGAASVPGFTIPSGIYTGPERRRS
jgi:hypothetical protein